MTLAEAVVLGATARWLVPFIFGQAFAPSVTPLWLLLPGTVAFTIPNILNAHLAGRGRPQISALAAGISLVATVSLDVLLIPRLSIAGAALASSIAYVVTALVVLTIFRRLTGLPWSAVLVLNAGDVRYGLSLIARGRTYLAHQWSGLRPQM
jgi:O-antigen/teichoic acid export membrane protein